MNNDTYSASSSDRFANLIKAGNETQKKLSANTNQNVEVDSNGMIADISNTQQQPTQEKGNFLERAWGSVLNAEYNVTYGFAKVFEGIIDTVAGAFEWINPEGVQDFIQMDLANKYVDFYQNTSGTSLLNKAITGKKAQDYRSQSYINETNEKVQEIVQGVEQGIGTSLGAVVLTATGGEGIGMAMYGVGATGMTLEQELQSENYDGNFLKTFVYSGVSGATEAVIEQFSGKVLGGMLNKVADVLPSTAGWLKNGIGALVGDYTKGNKVVTLLGQMAGEGMEEVIGNAIDPLYRAIYEDKTIQQSYQDNFSAEDTGKAFLIASLSAGITGSAMSVYNKMAFDTKTLDELNEYNQQVNELKEGHGEFTKEEYADKYNNVIKKGIELYDSIEGIKNEGKKQRTQELAYKSLEELINKSADGKKTAEITSDLVKEDIDSIAKDMNYDAQTLSTIQAINNSFKDKGKNINVELVDNLYVKDKNGKDVILGKDKEGFAIKQEANALYEPTTNTIQISKNASKDKSLNALMSHELLHNAKKSGIISKEIINEALNEMKKDSTYNKYADKVKRDYGANISQDLLDEEILANYFENLFNKTSDFVKMFLPKSQASKLKSILTKFRKQTTDEKLREKFANAISKINKVEQFNAEPSTTKYSVKSAKEIKDDAELRSDRVFTKDEAEAFMERISKITDVDNMVQEVKIENKENLTNELFGLFNEKINKKNFEETYSKYEKFATKIVENMTINNNKNIANALLGIISEDTKGILLKENAEFRNTIKGNLIEAITNKLLETRQKGGKLSLKSIVDITKIALTDRISELKAELSTSNKTTKKLVDLQHNFRDMYKDGKIFKDIRGRFSDIAKAFSQIRFLGTYSMGGDVRNVINNYRDLVNNGAEFKDLQSLNNELIKQELDYIHERYEQFKNREYKPKLNMSNKVVDDGSGKYSEIVGKTEAEMVVDILNNAKQMIKEATGTTTGFIDDNTTEVNVKEATQKEMDTQNQIARKLNIGQHKTTSYLSSLIDQQAYFNILANGNENSIFSKFYKRLVLARDKTYGIYRDLYNPILEYAKKHKDLIKNLGKEVEYKGKKIRLGDLISLYLAMETDNAQMHIQGEGIRIETDSGKAIEIEGLDFFNEAELKNKQLFKEQLESPHRLYTKKEIREFIKEINDMAYKREHKELGELIGNEYKEFISTIKEMYTKSGQYYMDASDLINGYHYVLKGTYYPTKVNPYSFNRNIGDLETNNMFINNAMSPSFTKKAIGSNKQLLISDVLYTATTFAKSLSTYAGVTAEVKNINKFLNARVEVEGSDVKKTLKQYITDNVDKRFVKRLDALFLAMQGIRTQENTDINKAMSWLRGASAKFALGLNAKTALSQFLSYPMAYTYLSSKSLLTGILHPRSEYVKYSFNDLMEKNSYAYNRYIENNLYNAEAVGALQSAKNVINSITDVAMMPIKLSDKATLSALWRASQIEAKGDFDLAMSLWQQAVEGTQPQYDPLNNGSATRVNSEIVKSSLMFTSVVRKYLSRIYEGVYNLSTAQKGQKSTQIKSLAKTMTGFTMAISLMTLLTTIFNSLKGKYDDKEKDEIIASIFKESVGTNLVGMFPIAKEIYNYLINGYEIDVVGVAQVNDLLKSISDIQVLFDASKTNSAKRTVLWDMTQSICKLFGVPARNLYNDVLVLAGLGDKAFDTNMAFQMKNFFYDTSNSGLGQLLKVYKAKGQEDRVRAVVSVKLNKNDASASADVSKELTRLYMNNSLDNIPSVIGDTITVNGEEIGLTNTMRRNMQQIYNMASSEMDDMINAYWYQNLTDEQKAAAIKKLYSAYYDYAKSNVIKDYAPSTKLSQLAEYIDIAKLSCYTAKTSSMQATTKQTKKEQVVSYINRLGITKQEKYLVLYLSGYKLSDENSNSVQKYLRSKGMTYKEARQYLEQ